MTIEELNDILSIDESYRVERTISTGNMDKFQEAICAFANDLPGKCQKGYLLIGVCDDGNARPENFPMINDYRNPIIAGAMKSLGYVNKYNRGIGQVQKELRENGNPMAEFDVNLLTAFAVEVKKCTSQSEKGYQLGTSQSKNGYQSGTSQKSSDHRPFGPKVLTLQERILEFCEEPKTLREIADFLGASNKKKVKAKYIDDILGTKIVMTIPDKPNSRLQKYVAIKEQLRS